MTVEPLHRNRRIWDRMAPGYDRQMRRFEPLLIGCDPRLRAIKPTRQAGQRG